MDEITLKVNEGSEITVEGLPLKVRDGIIWVNGSTELYDFDDEIIAHYDNIEAEFTLTLTPEQLNKAKAHREYVESLTEEDFS